MTNNEEAGASEYGRDVGDTSSGGSAGSNSLSTPKLSADMGRWLSGWRCAQSLKSVQGRMVTRGVRGYSWWKQESPENHDRATLGDISREYRIKWGGRDTQ